MSSALLKIRRPDDWHVHFRDGVALDTTVKPISQVFGRVVAMPNLQPPITTTEEAINYRERLLSKSVDRLFSPWPSLYLTDSTSFREINDFAASGFIAAKLYPAHATTNSSLGVSSIEKIEHILDEMARLGLVLQIHGESTDSCLDVFDREEHFVHNVLDPLCQRHPSLKIVLEHVTTAVGVEFVRSAGSNVSATITPHHLDVERSSLFAGGMKPHLYCLPVPKTRKDREALLGAAMGGETCFFLGSDSAPHRRSAKESGCCPAGVYCGHDTISYYADVFDRHGALDRLEAFSSEHGAEFYGFPLNEGYILLQKGEYQVPNSIPYCGLDELIPYRAGETLGWRVLCTGRLF